jgi:hypothetical protein
MGWPRFTHEVFGMDPNTCCSQPVTGYFLILLSPWIFTDPVFLAGIIARGYHHITYLNDPKQRDAYDEFVGKALQVVDVNVLTFATHVQALLVDHIRDVLEQPRADEKEWWTGAHGRWTLTHAGYVGSNNNVGVEVYWRDMKLLVPPCALVKNI